MTNEMISDQNLRTSLDIEVFICYWKS